MNYPSLNGLEFRGSYWHRVVVEIHPGSEYTLGSATTCGIVIAGEEISDEHARLAVSAQGRIEVKPVGGAPVSVNGTPVTTTAPVKHEDWLALGRSMFQVRCLFESPPAIQCTTGPTAATVPESSDPSFLIIGRSAEADIRIDSPLVALRQATLSLSRSGLAVLTHLNGAGCTYVNFQRLSSAVTLTAGDLIHIAGHCFGFNGQGVEPLPRYVGLSLSARELSLTDFSLKYGSATQISLAVCPGELFAIVSDDREYADALVRTLRGVRPPKENMVLFDGVCAERALPALRPAIGYVSGPENATQTLTATRTLYHAARIRCASDSTKDELYKRSLHVLQQIQRYRSPQQSGVGYDPYTELAVELLTRPRALFLEQSALDHTAGNLMELLSDLSASGLTIICSLDDPRAAEDCHLAAYLVAGHLAYLGPPQNAAAYFGIKRVEDLYSQLATAPAEQWAATYRLSPYFETYVRQRLQDSGKDSQRVSASSALPKWSVPRIAALTRRYREEMLARGGTFAWRLMLTPLLTLVIAFVVRGLSIGVSVATLPLISAFWIGLSPVAGTAISDRARRVRESDFDISIIDAAVGKIVPYAELGTVQVLATLAILSIAGLLPEFPPQNWMWSVCLMLLGVGVGLTLTAWLRTRRQRIGGMLLLLVAQYLLVAHFSWACSFASAFDHNTGKFFCSRPEHDSGAGGVDVFVPSAAILGYALASILAVGHQPPHAPGWGRRRQ